MRAFILTCALLLAAAPALASTPAPELGQIRLQQLEIKAALAAGTGRYQALPPERKSAIAADQAIVLRLLDNKESLADLSEIESIELFNRLESIEAAINNADDERVTCVRERKTGSNRTVRICRTQLEIREARERARRQNEGTLPLGI